tara:strand:+ start:614 stop:871 length:258 start_codon:yes stop_codon:yes gene_type:complete
MPYWTSSETATILGYFCRSDLYKVHNYGSLKPYEVRIDGGKYVNFHPRVHSLLDQYLKGILKWRPSNPIRKMKYMYVYVNYLQFE